MSNKTTIIRPATNGVALKMVESGERYEDSYRRDYRLFIDGKRMVALTFQNYEKAEAIRAWKGEVNDRWSTKHFVAHTDAFGWIDEGALYKAKEVFDEERNTYFNSPPAVALDYKAAVEWLHDWLQCEREDWLYELDGKCTFKIFEVMDDVNPKTDALREKCVYSITAAKVIEYLL